MPKLTAILLILSLATALAEEKITYTDQVRPLFENRCFNCHNPDKAKGGLDLTTYTNTMAGGSSGKIIAPGASADSRLFQSISHTAEPTMPPKGDKMPKAELDLIAKWIDTGVLETSKSTARKPEKPAFDLTVQDTGPGRPEGPPPMPRDLLLDPPTITPRAGAVADIASSPWAPLAALTGQKQVLLYNTDTHQLAGILPFPEGFPEHLNFSRNGSLLLAAGGRGGKSGRVVVWDIKTGQRAIEVGNEYDTILAADITPDLSLIALGGPSRRIKIYNTTDGSELISIKKHTDWITALSFSPDGKLLATGDRNGGLFVWEATTGNPLYTLKGHSKTITSVTWRADSNIVASASEDGTVRLWEMKEGKQVKNWNAHPSGVTDLDFTRDGLLISTGRDRQAKIWDQNGAAKRTIKGFQDIPLATAFTHDGKNLITGDWSGQVIQWNSADGKKIATLNAAPPAIATRLAKLQKEHDAQLPIIAAAKKKHANITARIPTLEDRGTQAKKRITALNQQRKNADKNLQAARKAIASATTARDQADATNKTKFEEKLKQANADLGAATAKLSQLDQQLTETQNGLKARQAEIQKFQESAKQSQARLEEAEKPIAAIQKQRRYWQAAQINTQRLTKLKEMTKLKAELAHLKQAKPQQPSALKTTTSKLTQLETETKQLWAEYQATLPQ